VDNDKIIEKTQPKAAVRTKAKTNATTTKASSRSKSAKSKKTNLIKLCTMMSKLAIDAVDKEIIKRFKIIIDTTDGDLTKSGLDIVTKDPKNVDMNSYHESLQPYIKHYLFMLKRDMKSS